MTRIATPRLLTTVLCLTLLAAAVTVFFPGTALALWAERTTYNYYSDATHTVRVGRCVENGCTGVTTCSGQITEFETSTTVPIACSGL